VLVLDGDGGPVGVPSGLVVHVGRDLAELVAVLAGVVRAEEKLATALERHAQVGLGAAAVTTVDRGQRGLARGCRSVHVGLSLWCICLFNAGVEEKFPSFRVSPGTTSNHG
jgi:hypothetical protein